MLRVSLFGPSPSALGPAGYATGHHKQTRHPPHTPHKIAGSNTVGPPPKLLGRWGLAGVPNSWFGAAAWVRDFFGKLDHKQTKPPIPQESATELSPRAQLRTAPARKNILLMPSFLL